MSSAASHSSSFRRDYSLLISTWSVKISSLHLAQHQESPTLHVWYIPLIHAQRKHPETFKLCLEKHKNFERFDVQIVTWFLMRKSQEQKLWEFKAKSYSAEIHSQMLAKTLRRDFVCLLITI